ncbi:hypothetical protein OG992_29890 [Micromonospora sp. NBC_00362]|uniref:hypothetical protein n=1 Tax=unclassified Micromonospora TaxID=2617518 RepID=UPI002250E14F|nr:hypothetical protein [Micromonospora sp. NBC_00362]MCX5121398.1 hypothetical protein [Micromonospora sp. NBC_00362]WTI06641.1 hypothetical protein OHB44_24950 [Micromonospora sp. NBC_00821]
MRAGNLLRQLDQRLLPPLTRAVARLGDRSARSGVLSWAAVLSAAAVLGTAVWAVDDTPVGDRTVGEVTRVGVADGDSVPGYLRSAAADLAALPASPPAAEGGTYALVTLDAYLPPQRLATVLGDVGVSTVFGRVPLPGRQTEIVKIPALRVPDDVVAGMEQVAARKETEAADYRARAAAVDGDGVGERELREQYVGGAEVAAAEAAAYRTGCACVYAAVVRATPVALRGVAARPDVRAVDPAPEVYRLDRTVFTPPLPEQRDVVRPPADTGPSPAPTRSERPAPMISAPAPSTPVGESSEPAPVVTIPSPEPSKPEPTESAAPSVTTSPDATLAEPSPPSPSS